MTDLIAAVTRKAEPKPNGRPSIRTAEIVESILEQIGDGVPLAKICRQPGMPKLRTFYDWAEADEELSALVARARKAGHDNIAFDMMEIADQPPAYKQTAEGMSIDQGDVAHRKLQIDTRQKLLRCWDPKNYGDKLEVDNKGNMAVAVTIQRLADGPVQGAHDGEGEPA